MRSEGSAGFAILRMPSKVRKKEMRPDVRRETEVFDRYIYGNRYIR